MDVYFEPKNIKYLSSRQPDIHSSEDVIEYLKAEYHEMISIRFERSYSECESLY